MARLSGLQKEVITLYRRCLREAGKKPEATKANFKAVTRREFHKHQALDKKDFAAVETLLRMGYRKLELYSAPGVTDIH